MNFGPSTGCSVGGLSKTVGIRKDLIWTRWQMGDDVSVLCVSQEEAYADGVPQQDLPVKVASRSSPVGTSGQGSVTEKEVRP
jgi:hypothetical protein